MGVKLGRMETCNQKASKEVIGKEEMKLKNPTKEKMRVAQAAHLFKVMVLEEYKKKLMGLRRSCGWSWRIVINQNGTSPSEY